MSFCNAGALDTPDPHKLFQILQPLGQFCPKVIENPGIFVFSWLRKWTTDPLAVLVREMALLVINKALTLTWCLTIALHSYNRPHGWHGAIFTIDSWQLKIVILTFSRIKWVFYVVCNSCWCFEFVPSEFWKIHRRNLSNSLYSKLVR